MRLAQVSSSPTEFMVQLHVQEYLTQNIRERKNKQLPSKPPNAASYIPPQSSTWHYSDFFESLMEFGKLVLSSGMYIKERGRQRQREFGSEGSSRTIFLSPSKIMKLLSRMKLWAAGNYPIIGKVQ